MGASDAAGSGKAGWTVMAWVAWVAWVVYAVVLALTAYKASSYTASPISPRVAYLLIGLSVLVFLAALRDLAPLFIRAVVCAVAGGTVALVGFALAWRLIGSGTKPPPRSITDVTNPAQFGAVLAYARSITYDSVTHDAGDSALIVDTVRGSLDTVRAWAVPARNAHLNSYDDLGPGRGRVVARIRVAGRGYPALGLPAGVSYIWVDSLRLQDTTGTFRALIIPDRPGGQVIQFPTSKGSRYHFRAQGTFVNFPIARWVLYHSTCVNVPCSKGCCLSCPS